MTLPSQPPPTPTSAPLLFHPHPGSRRKRPVQPKTALPLMPHHLLHQPPMPPHCADLDPLQFIFILHSSVMLIFYKLVFCLPFSFFPKYDFFELIFFGVSLAAYLLNLFEQLEMSIFAICCQVWRNNVRDFGNGFFKSSFISSCSQNFKFQWFLF